ncbi:hypothetical protein GNP73_07985 [Aliivibrio fischeri]|uniref:hypothetical protein n=1 Tax=Aliivibrio fischeri TaxID=668 RepID=UPI0012DA28FD|nr:hypothetical protein [Aliivibrio fischeri]MUJ27917.1 hypothetical protein [Aliivibrio fischeri]
MLKKLAISLGVIIGLTACSERDFTYYQANIDKAQEKIAECEIEMKKAFMDGDAVRLQKTAEDVECKAATNAYNEYERKVAQLERDKREEEQRKQRELDEAQFAKDLEKYTNQLTNMSFEEFYKFDRNCSFSRTAQCKAFKNLKEARTADELSRLITQYPKEQLEAYSQKQCKGIEYDKNRCSLSRDAVYKQKKDQVNYYLDNRNALVSMFNTCQAKYAKFRKAQKFTDAQKSVDTFDCRMVANAASKLNVYSFAKPIK